MNRVLMTQSGFVTTVPVAPAVMAATMWTEIEWSLSERAKGTHPRSATTQITELASRAQHVDGCSVLAVHHLHVYRRFQNG